MSRMFSIKFRGEDHDVEITRDGGYEPDTGAHDIEWHFVDDNVGRDMTADEEENAFDQIFAVINDPHYHDDSDLDRP